MDANRDHKNEQGLLPYEVIRKAKAGDPESVEIVVRHFDWYMNNCSIRPYRVYENSYVYLPDQEIKDELILRLLEAITKFKM